MLQVIRKRACCLLINTTTKQRERKTAYQEEKYELHNVYYMDTKWFDLNPLADHQCVALLLTAYQMSDKYGHPFPYCLKRDARGVSTPHLATVSPAALLSRWMETQRCGASEKESKPPVRCVPASLKSLHWSNRRSVRGPTSPPHTHGKPNPTPFELQAKTNYFGIFLPTQGKNWLVLHLCHITIL